MLSRVEWLALVLALLLLPELSWGQAGSGASAASLFDRLDRNKDGYLSREELATEEALNRNWIAVDRDRDGRISRAEFGLVAVPSAPQPSAAAGASQAPQPGQKPQTKE